MTYQFIDGPLDRQTIELPQMRLGAFWRYPLMPAFHTRIKPNEEFISNKKEAIYYVEKDRKLVFHHYER